VRPDVRAMLEKEGLYLGGDTRHPNVIVPLWSSGGKVSSMKIDAELAPERFAEYLTLKGPYTPETPDPAASPAYYAAAEQVAEAWFYTANVSSDSRLGKALAALASAHAAAKGKA
jgi:hypothetical protein